jgi:cation diffusion facilitator CzcD-associated flavoprotein CzcO
VAVIGAGPGGLGVAGALKQRGIQSTVFERADHVAPAWRQAYDRLRLNTTRSRSRLPGQRMPRRFGVWPTRGDFITYLDRYTEQHDLDIRLGVQVEGIEPCGRAWTMSTSIGPAYATQVIVATGYNTTPVVPRWADDDRFAGTVLHSSQYRTGATFTGERVVVVGAGNSGADIVVDLLNHGAEVAVAIRTPPNLVPRHCLGIPADMIGVALRRLPASVGDKVVALASRAAFGDLRRHGLPTPPEGAMTRHRRDGTEPVIDTGFVHAIRHGRITLLPAVHALTATGVAIADGRTHDADVIVTATGFRTDLAQIVGRLDILDGHGLPIVHGAKTDPRYPGLRFIGFTNPISGRLRELRHDARRIATALQCDLAREGAPRWSRMRACRPLRASLGGHAIH